MRRRYSSPSEAVIEGQVLSRSAADPAPQITQVGPPVQGGPDLSQPLPQQQPQMTDTDFVALEQKARAVALFLKIPFFSWVALNGELPGLVRIGAAVLGAMEVRQLYQAQGAIEAMLPDQMQGYY